MQSFRPADGRTLTYRREGVGPTLVCHPGRARVLVAVLRRPGGPRRAFTLILLGPRGTGGSDRPADPGARYGAEERRFVAWLGEERPNKDALDLFNTQIWDV